MDILITTTLAILSLVWLLDGLRLRRRSKAMVVLQPDGRSSRVDSYQVIARAGVKPSEAMVCAAIQYAAEEDLKVLGLVADDCNTAESMLSLQSVDLGSFRTARMGSARMIGEFFVVHTEILDRMDRDILAPKTTRDFVKLATEFKKYAFVSMDFAIMRGLRRQSPSPLSLSPELLKYFFGPIGAPWLLMQLAVMGVGFFYAPSLAAFALLLYILQPLIVLVKTPFHGADLFMYSGLRPWLDAKTMLQSFFLPNEDEGRRKTMLEEKRTMYRELLSRGTDRFFEEKRCDCPICGKTEIEHFITTRDRFQFKPGYFHVDRCQSCSHIFQNPRLSIDGLDFYYKDFYDGLGEERLEGIFSHGNGPYLARAKMMEGQPTPSRWLDVGGGHGHFCLLAREVFPDAKFDGLDLSSSVIDAEKKGWTNRSYCGLFPDLADAIAENNHYDVISMSHYLEHTREPALEIEAAAKVLGEGGHLLIELPDPESRFGKIFRSFWLPWLQPQHQHFLSASNLERLLKANHFVPVTWHRGEAHHPIDIMFSFGLMVTQIAKPLDLPWLPLRSTKFRRFLNPLIFALSMPFLLLSRVLDLLLAPLLRRPGWSNAYRVLARRSA